jgi:hypothetical protein
MILDVIRAKTWALPKALLRAKPESKPERHDFGEAKNMLRFANHDGFAAMIRAKLGRHPGRARMMVALRPCHPREARMINPGILLIQVVYLVLKIIVKLIISPSPNNTSL